jgi:hypothetical protein
MSTAVIATFVIGRGSEAAPGQSMVLRTATLIMLWFATALNVVAPAREVRRTSVPLPYLPGPC